MLPALVPGTRLDLGIGAALLATALVWFALRRRAWGLRLRLVGYNAGFADYAGSPARAVTLPGWLRRRRRPQAAEARA